MDEIQASVEELITELSEAALDEEIVRNFATIGAVYEDGVSLIFDGEDEPTEKHYLCNTNVYFSPGDRVRILADGGTYIVEYVVGAPRQSALHGIPAGGSADQVLTKDSGTSYDASWQTPRYVPSGGTTGYVLTKTANGYAWVAADMIPSGGSTGQVLTKTASGYGWTTPDYVPSSGTTGYILTKTANGYAWAAAPTGLPSGGSNGQVLQRTSSGYQWVSINEVPSSGTTGYVLTKTANGYGWAASNGVPSGGTAGQVLTKTTSGFGWAAVPTEIPSSGTTGYVLTKTASGFGWSAVPMPTAVANQINTNASYQIQFRTQNTYSSPPVFQIRMGTSGTWYTLTHS